ncbi:hypothetical protein L6164_003564 [Bauhinia variegata]|uniref:Uncharacterized protein n=1 Tax=Bauhinia variegata TaxID=167791 RepID=A0ACB9Q1R6_BAUVA|nr:hypothetical protein L6164_003564 [Bauhinia variegata]
MATINTKEEQSQKLHIAVFPWLAFGHIIPFFELAKLTAQKDHKISFISTSRNIQRLPKLPPNLKPCVDLIEIPLPQVDKLPEDAEATMDVPEHIVPNLKRAFDGLEQPVAQFLQISKPDWIIYDFAHYWLPPINAKFGILGIFFNILMSTSRASLADMLQDLLLRFLVVFSYIMATINTMEEQSKKLHIAVFPWLAFGHIIPFFELAKLIAQKGHKISFISTPRNIQRLSKIPPNLKPCIDLTEIPLPHVDKLPEDAEATMDVPEHTVPYLKKAFDGLEQPLAQFLHTSKPDWIIYDFAPYWLPPINAKLGILGIHFNIFSAFGVSFYLDTLLSQASNTSSEVSDGGSGLRTMGQTGIH